MVDKIDFQINPADLQLMHPLTEGNKGSGLLWLLLILGVLVLGFILYLHLSDKEQKTAQLVPNEM